MKLLVWLVGWSVLLAGAGAAQLRVQERGDRFILADGLGRERLLRGINLATLGGGGSDVPTDTRLYANGSCPANDNSWYQPPICEHDVRELAGLGFDSIRLLVHWSQIEPQPGVYDRRYFARLEQIIGWCEAHGVGVLLDLHQDNFANISHACCADDGAPGWAWLVNQTELGLAAKAEIKLMNKLIPQLDWSGAEVAFADFWQNKKVASTGWGLQQHYIQAVAQLVNATMGRSGVIGYELMNEPLPGLDIDLWHFGLHSLYPFYARLIQAITGERDGMATCACNVTAALGLECAPGASPVSPTCAYPDLELHTDKLMVFEPMALRNQLDVSLQWSRPFSQYPNLVYAPHSYSRAFTIWKKDPFWLALGTATAEARAMNAAVMVTEWGGGNISIVKQIGLEQQQYMVNGMAWVWKQNNGGGWSLHSAVSGGNFTLNRERLAAVSRIYPRWIAAELTSYAHDDSGFSLTARCDGRTNATTEIYFPVHFAACSNSISLHGAASLVKLKRSADGSVTAFIQCVEKGDFRVGSSGC